MTLQEYQFLKILIKKKIFAMHYKFFLLQGFIGEPGPRGASGPTGDAVSAVEDE